MSFAAVAIGTAAVGAGVGVYNVVEGKKQKDKAKKEMEGLHKPVYQIPQEILDNLSDAEKRTVEGLPAEKKQEYVKNMERNQQNYLKNAEDRKAGLAGLQDSTNRANDQLSNLVSKDAEAKRRNEIAKRNEIATARAGVANAKNQQFAFNMNDYQSQLQSAQANYQAGAQNLNSGIQQIGSSVVQAGGSLAGGAGGSGGGNKFNF
jgi:hypothetical protein